MTNSNGGLTFLQLLRRFSKQMSITTLAEEEDCPICFERLKPMKSYAYAYQSSLTLRWLKQSFLGCHVNTLSALGAFHKSVGGSMKQSVAPSVGKGIPGKK